MAAANNCKPPPPPVPVIHHHSKTTAAAGYQQQPYNDDMSCTTTSYWREERRALDGIVVALRAAAGMRGVVVGLDRLIDLGGQTGTPGTAADGDAAPENVSGQAATATSVPR